MALATYSDLKTSIAGWLMRDDLTAVIPDFITLAEQVINDGTDDQLPLRTAAMETTATLAVDANGNATLPADYLQMISAAPGTAGYDDLSLSAPNAMVAYNRGAGVPQWFTVIGNTVRTYPYANANIGIVYFAKVPALSDSNPTNWLLTRSPGVYLYGSLLHTAPYLADDPRVATWGTLYKQLVGGLNGSDRAARFSNATTRTRGPTP